MQPHFTAEFFIQNRRKLVQQADCELIVVAANGLMQRGADSPFPFAQDANFWYLTGVNEPDLVLVMDGDRDYLIVPGRSESREAFDGSVSHAAIQKMSGVDRVYDEKEGWQQLAMRVQKLKRVGSPAVPPAYIEQTGLYTNPSRGHMMQRLQAAAEDFEVVDVSSSLWRLRCRKQPAELAAIQHAIDVTTATLQDITAPAVLTKYEYEYEIEAALSCGFRKRGSAGHAFEPIVASGQRGCTLHYVANNGRLAKNKLVVLDVGAQVDMYAADITRTLCYGRPSSRQRAVHEAVLTVHDYASSLLKPGIFIREYEEQVREFLGRQLVALGVMTHADKDAIRRYYPHATSHFLGLNVHDVGEYDQPLAENMVLTVEPGIYIPEEGIGVRIEDDVVITKTGIKNLSDALPRQLA